MGEDVQHNQAWIAGDEPVGRIALCSILAASGFGPVKVVESSDALEPVQLGPGVIVVVDLDSTFLLDSAAMTALWGTLRGARSRGCLVVGVGMEAASLPSEFVFLPKPTRVTAFTALRARLVERLGPAVVAPTERRMSADPEVLELAKLIEMYGSDREDLRYMLEEYRDHGHGLHQDYRAALRAWAASDEPERRQTLQRCAHRLCGSAGAVGATRVCDATKTLMHLSATAPGDTFGDAARVVEALLARLEADIDARLRAGSARLVAS
jgi:HPt (histidine-containing phosphotransfer) domain-containing protein